MEDIYVSWRAGGVRIRKGTDETMRNTDKSKDVKKIIKRILLVIILLSFVLYLGIGAVFSLKGYGMYWRAVHESSLTERVEEVRSSECFTAYSELPAFYINATVAVEDRRFRWHMGVDPIAICRALWTDIRAGAFVEGGSTITQQLAKNMLFTQEKKVERKIAEMLAAIQMEFRYTKQEIFELYVNTAYFGSGYYGIYQASMGYFGKEPSELTDYESAMLAGVLNAPSAYSPDTHRELAQQRTAQVLNKMVKYGIITRGEADRIIRESSL